MTHPMTSSRMRFGRQGELCLNIPAESLVADCSSPRGQRLSDPAAAVAQALADPLEFPALGRATMPGDQVAVALERGLPDLGSLVAGIVGSLLDNQVEAADIALVIPGDEPGDTPAEGQRASEVLERLLDDLPVGVGQRIRRHVHDPADRSQLAYLAASRQGQPIYLNRLLCDADVVLPVSLARLPETLGSFGVHGGLFPTFSDQATLQRFRAPSSASWQALQQRRREEAEEAAWLLGCQLTVQVVPGAGDEILHVLAGDGPVVAARGRELCAEAWQFETEGRANLVVTTIEGGADQQTWENLARAVQAAVQVVEPGGAVAVCTELACRPGPALRQLAAGRDDDRLQHDLRRQKSADAVPASVLLEARQRAHLYLVSRLDRDLVENLGLGYVDQVEDIDRLRSRFGSCILLGNGHRARIDLPGGREQ